LLTVPEAARRIGRNPETIRRWIRTGRLRSRRIGTQHVIDERDLEQLVDGVAHVDVPEGWSVFADGAPQPDWEHMLRRSRSAH
jgi:excisionase family DNA binding protein